MWASPVDAVQLSLKNGDLLVCEGGDVGRCAIYAGDKFAIFQNSVHRVRPREGADNRYLYYVLQALHSSEYLDVLTNKATIRHFTADKFESLTIPYPSLAEQRRIADFLDTETSRIDRMVSMERRQRDLVSERLVSVLKDLVVGEKGPLLNTFEPKIRPGSGWSMMPLSKVLVALTNGYVGPTRDILQESGVRYLQSLHIKKGKILFERGPYYVSKEWASARPRISLKVGDLLIVQTGAIGEVALVDEVNGGASCHALLIAKPDRTRIDPEYLWAIFRSHWGVEILLREQTGALHPHLEAGKVRDIKIPVPDLGVQRAIASDYRNEAALAMRVLQLSEQRSKLLAERRQALITAAVTGQLDVTTARSGL